MSKYPTPKFGIVSDIDDGKKLSPGHQQIQTRDLCDSKQEPHGAITHRGQIYGSFYTQSNDFWNNHNNDNKLPGK